MRSLIPGEEDSHLKSSYFEVEFSNFVGEGYLKKRKQITQTKSKSQIFKEHLQRNLFTNISLIVLLSFSGLLSKKQAKIMHGYVYLRGISLPNFCCFSVIFVRAPEDLPVLTERYSKKIAWFQTLHVIMTSAQYVKLLSNCRPSHLEGGIQLSLTGRELNPLILLGQRGEQTLTTPLDIKWCHCNLRPLWFFL